jgi:hypothetical protein
MPDTNFFNFSGPTPLSKIAELASADIKGDAGDYMITGVAALDQV